MAYKNLIDDTSTTVSASTPGAELDLRQHTTLSRASLGVPVRLWVFAESTVANDTGAVIIVDDAGATKLAVPITGTTAKWYAVDGWLPATDAKYDAHYGGNTLGTLKVYQFTLEPFGLLGANEGVLSSSIGSITLTATNVIEAQPASAAAIAAAIGYGTFTHGWLLDDASGNAAAAFGGVTLTASGSPTYASAGPLGSTNKAVGFGASAVFTGTDILDAGSDDLVFAWIAKLTTGSNADLAGKGWAASGSWLFCRESDGYTFYFKDDSGTTLGLQPSAHIGDWHVGIICVDRANDLISGGTRNLRTGAVSIPTATDISSLTSQTNGSNFAIGSQGIYGPDGNALLAGFYAGTGSGAAGALSANMAAALYNLAEVFS